MYVLAPRSVSDYLYDFVFSNSVLHVFQVFKKLGFDVMGLKTSDFVVSSVRQIQFIKKTSKDATQH